jgi:putative tricarboxylic transport membrane protein
LRIRSPSDFWAGVLFIAVGVAVVVLAGQYRLGSAARMGPGYFPTLLGGLMTFLGLTLAAPALLKDGPQVPAMRLRPLLMILLSIAVFGVTLDYLGFVLAVVALVVVAGFADPELRPIEAAGVAIFLVVFSVGIFVGLLGLPLNLWPDL